MSKHDDFVDAVRYALLPDLPYYLTEKAVEGYPDFLTKCLNTPIRYDPGIGPAQRMLLSKKGDIMEFKNGTGITMSVAESEYLSEKGAIEQEAQEKLAKAQAERNAKLRKEDAEEWADQIMVKYEALIARGMPEDKAFEIVKITV